MLLSAKLDMVFAVFVEAAATIFTSNAFGYPPTAGFTFTQNINGHLMIYLY
jgi:hypothetical protein